MNNDNKTRPIVTLLDGKIGVTENDTISALKLTGFSAGVKAAYLKNPFDVITVGNGELSGVPDIMDAFRLDDKEKTELLFGFDIGDHESQLRYELNDKGNVDRFRYGFDGNMVMLGQVMENQAGFKNQPLQNKITSSQVVIGQRFKIENESFEVYSVGSKGILSYHDLKAGMEDHYKISTEDFFKMVGQGTILLSNRPTPVSTDWTITEQAATQNGETERIVGHRKG